MIFRNFFLLIVRRGTFRQCFLVVNQQNHLTPLFLNQQNHLSPLDIWKSLLIFSAFVLVAKVPGSVVVFLILWNTCLWFSARRPRGLALNLIVSDWWKCISLEQYSSIVQECGARWSSYQIVSLHRARLRQRRFTHPEKTVEAEGRTNLSMGVELHAHRSQRAVSLICDSHNLFYGKIQIEAAVEQTWTSILKK